MQSISIIPHPVLQPFIQAFIYSSVGMPGQKMVLDLCPVGHAVLTFILDEHPSFHNVYQDKHYSIRFNFTGQLSKYHLLHTSPASMIYVMFRPYGVFRLLGVPQHQLTNEATSMSDILQGDVNDLCKRMEDQAKHPLTVVKLLEEWLLKQWKKNEKLNTDRMAYACEEIIRNTGALSVKNLCSLTNMSKSSLEQYFKEQVGLTPKMYSRVIRFNAVHQSLKRSPDHDWQELIYRFGYFDQSHFIHEFKHFFGYTPSQAHLSDQNLAVHLSGHLPG